MFQRWRSLLFLHFAAEPATIQSHLPPGLTVDTFPDAEGVERAWVGLVPFRMEGVRWNGLPPLPGTHTFLETNIRTYVHREGREPGVWFFSLDAANALACAVARRLYSLPYFPATMRMRQADGRMEFTGDRRPSYGGQAAAYAVDAELGGSLGSAEPGTLEFFLLERYLLYSTHRGRLKTGRVWHTPYPMRAVLGWHARENLVDAAGLPFQPFTHALFSEGVDVSVYGLRSVDD